MATFRTTPRMNPALRARVERAVSHRSRASHHAARIGLKTRVASAERLRVASVLPLIALVLVVGLGTATYAHERRAFEQERTAVLTALAERRAGLPAGHEGFVAETNRWIAEAVSETAPADVIDPALRAPGALDAWLRRPAVYVRGAAAELRSAGKLDDAARPSIKDAFLYCLVSPPASAEERDLLAKVRGVYFAGAKVDEQTANVRRLVEARIGLEVLGPGFESAVRSADDIRTLKKLQKELQGAPTDEARQAVAAELLIVMADEASQTNLREARVSVIDLASKKVVLRVRPHIDSGGRSAAAVVHRDDVESCGLSLAVRRSVDG
jgi:hypothetical protein